MTTNTNEKIAAEALDAFWQVVVAKFPQAETGDLSPLTTITLVIAAENAVEEWIWANVPQQSEE